MSGSKAPATCLYPAVIQGWAAPSLTSSTSTTASGLKTVQVFKTGSNGSFLKVFILHKYGSLIKLLVLQGRASASDLQDQTGGGGGFVLWSGVCMVRAFWLTVSIRFPFTAAPVCWYIKMRTRLPDRD